LKDDFNEATVAERTGGGAAAGHFLREAAFADSGVLNYLSALELRVLMVYLRHADNDTGVARPGLRGVADRAANGNRTRASEAIKRLQDKGLLVLVKRGGGAKNTTHYRVVAPTPEQVSRIAGESGYDRKGTEARRREQCPNGNGKGVQTGAEQCPNGSGTVSTLDTRTPRTAHRTAKRELLRTADAAGVCASGGAEEDTGVDREPPGFLRFWKLYPKSTRTYAGRAAALAYWQAHDLERDADAIVSSVRKAVDEEWWESQYHVPPPAQFLEDEQWVYSDDPPEVPNPHPGVSSNADPVARVRRAYCSQWAKRHRAEYPWSGRDDAAAAKLWSACGADPNKVAKVLLAYFAVDPVDRDAFFQGHPLHHLTHDNALPRFLAVASGANDSGLVTNKRHRSLAEWEAMEAKILAPRAAA
jgi:hypothetical protein